MNHDYLKTGKVLPLQYNKIFKNNQIRKISPLIIVLKQC